MMRGEIRGVCIIAVAIILFTMSMVSVKGDAIVRATTPQEYVALLNWISGELDTHCTFRCQDYNKKLPILEIHTPYTEKGLKIYRERTEEMMTELALNWSSLTKSSTIYLFDMGRDFEDIEDDNLVFILEKGDVIEPGKFM